jgi:hypothetical protein
MLDAMAESKAFIQGIAFDAFQYDRKTILQNLPPLVPLLKRLYGNPILFMETGDVAGEALYAAMGQTEAGRYLIVPSGALCKVRLQFLPLSQLPLSLSMCKG